MHVLGRHLVHEREERHRLVHEVHGHVGARQPRVGLDADLGRQRERLDALPVAQHPERRPGGEQVVQVRGAGARQAGDDDRRHQLDVVDLRVPRQQVGEQQPVLEDLEQLHVEVQRARAVQPVDLAHRGDEHVEPLAVVLRPEVVEPGLGPGLVVEHVDVERAVGGHQVHEGPDLLDLGRELRLSQVVDLHDVAHGHSSIRRSAPLP